MAPRNSFSACLRAPREIHISDSAAYFTGVAKNDRIAGDRLDLLHRGHVIPLGLSSEFRIPSSEFGNAPYALCYALCPLRHALYVMHHACRSTGVQLFLKQVSHKAPPTHNEGGAFLFCLPHESWSLGLT